MGVIYIYGAFRYSWVFYVYIYIYIHQDLLFKDVYKMFCLFRGCLFLGG